MDICIITDGNNTIGLGHIYQSKTFARYVADNQRFVMGGVELSS